MLKSEAEEPFTVFRMLPRMPVPFSHCSLQSSGIGGNLLTLESDPNANFFKFFGELVCCTIRVHCNGWLVLHP